ncbi:MAG: hypothetical protein KKE64_07575, partial [Candidatus Omnitrophica bacterium]|nr:hypothetical protein [Candidatus Omnitrophota bacterium]
MLVAISRGGSINEPCIIEGLLLGLVFSKSSFQFEAVIQAAAWNLQKKHLLAKGFRDEHQAKFPGIGADLQMVLTEYILRYAFRKRGNKPLDDDTLIRKLMPDTKSGEDRVAYYIRFNPVEYRRIHKKGNYFISARSALQWNIYQLLRYSSEGSLTVNEILGQMGLTGYYSSDYFYNGNDGLLDDMGKDERSDCHIVAKQSDRGIVFTTEFNSPSIQPIGWSANSLAGKTTISALKERSSSPMRLTKPIFYYESFSDAVFTPVFLSEEEITELEQKVRIFIIGEEKLKEQSLSKILGDPGSGRYGKSMIAARYENQKVYTIFWQYMKDPVVVTELERGEMLVAPYSSFSNLFLARWVNQARTFLAMGHLKHKAKIFQFIEWLNPGITDITLFCLFYMRTLPEEAGHIDESDNIHNLLHKIKSKFPRAIIEHRIRPYLTVPNEYIFFTNPQAFGSVPAVYVDSLVPYLISWKELQKNAQADEHLKEIKYSSSGILGEGISETVNRQNKRLFERGSQILAHRTRFDDDPEGKRITQDSLRKQWFINLTEKEKRLVRERLAKEYESYVEKFIHCEIPVSFIQKLTGGMKAGDDGLRDLTAELRLALWEAINAIEQWHPYFGGFSTFLVKYLVRAYKKFAYRVNRKIFREINDHNILSIDIPRGNRMDEEIIKAKFLQALDSLKNFLLSDRKLFREPRVIDYSIDGYGRYILKALKMDNQTYADLARMLGIERENIRQGIRKIEGFVRRHSDRPLLPSLWQIPGIIVELQLKAQEIIQHKVMQTDETAIARWAKMLQAWLGLQHFAIEGAPEIALELNGKKSACVTLKNFVLYINLSHIKVNNSAYRRYLLRPRLSNGQLLVDVFFPDASKNLSTLYFARPENKSHKRKIKLSSKIFKPIDQAKRQWDDFVNFTVDNHPTLSLKRTAYKPQAFVAFGITFRIDKTQNPRIPGETKVFIGGYRLDKNAPLFKHVFYIPVRTLSKNSLIVVVSSSEEMNDASVQDIYFLRRYKKDEGGTMVQRCRISAFARLKPPYPKKCFMHHSIQPALLREMFCEFISSSERQNLHKTMDRLTSEVEAYERKKAEGRYGLADIYEHWFAVFRMYLIKLTAFIDYEQEFRFRQELAQPGLCTSDLISIPNGKAPLTASSAIGKAKLGGAVSETSPLNSCSSSASFNKISYLPYFIAEKGIRLIVAEGLHDPQWFKRNSFLPDIFVLLKAERRASQFAIIERLFYDEYFKYFSEEPSHLAKGALKEREDIIAQSSSPARKESDFFTVILEGKKGPHARVHLLIINLIDIFQKRLEWDFEQYPIIMGHEGYPEDSFSLKSDLDGDHAFTRWTSMLVNKGVTHFKFAISIRGIREEEAKDISETIRIAFGFINKIAGARISEIAPLRGKFIQEIETRLHNIKERFGVFGPARRIQESNQKKQSSSVIWGCNFKDLSDSASTQDRNKNTDPVEIASPGMGTKEVLINFRKLLYRNFTPEYLQKVIDSAQDKEESVDGILSKQRLHIIAVAQAIALLNGNPGVEYAKYLPDVQKSLNVPLAGLRKFYRVFEHDITAMIPVLTKRPLPFIKDKNLEQITERVLEAILKAAGGKKSLAARIFGCSLGNIYLLLNKRESQQILIIRDVKILMQILGMSQKNLAISMNISPTVTAFRWLSEENSYHIPQKRYGELGRIFGEKDCFVSKKAYGRLLRRILFHPLLDMNAGLPQTEDSFEGCDKNYLRLRYNIRGFSTDKLFTLAVKALSLRWVQKLSECLEKRSAAEEKLLTQIKDISLFHFAKLTPAQRNTHVFTAGLLLLSLNSQIKLQAKQIMIHWFMNEAQKYFDRTIAENAIVDSVNNYYVFNNGFGNFYKGFLSYLRISMKKRSSEYIGPRISNEYKKFLLMSQPSNVETDRILVGQEALAVFSAALADLASADRLLIVKYLAEAKELTIPESGRVSVILKQLRAALEEAGIENSDFLTGNGFSIEESSSPFSFPRSKQLAVDNPADLAEIMRKEMLSIPLASDKTAGSPVTVERDMLKKLAVELANRDGSEATSRGRFLNQNRSVPGLGNSHGRKQVFIYRIGSCYWQKNTTDIMYGLAR